MKELFSWWVGCAFVKRHGLDPRDVYPPLSSFILALLGVDDELWILERLDPPLFKRKGHPGPGLRTVRKACSWKAQQIPICFHTVVGGESYHMLVFMSWWFWIIGGSIHINNSCYTRQPLGQETGLQGSAVKTANFGPQYCLWNRFFVGCKM